MKRVGGYCLIVVINQEELEVLSLAVPKRDRVLLFSSVSLCWCVLCMCVCVFSSQACSSLCNGIMGRGTWGHGDVAQRRHRVVERNVNGECMGHGSWGWNAVRTNGHGALGLDVGGSNGYCLFDRKRRGNAAIPVS